MKRNEFIYTVTSNLVAFFLWVFYRYRAWGTENVPRTGAVILAPNHISNIDPPMVAYFAAPICKRRPAFLAKASLWKKWPLGPILSGCGMIPVERGSGDGKPTEVAEQALLAGECVVVYPEATITTDPDLMPMKGKTGVARLALATGAPVVPMAIWGAQWMLGKGRVWRYFGHRLIYFKAGAPMTFPEYEGVTPDKEILEDVTARVMAEVEILVRDLRKIHPDGGAVPPMKVKKPKAGSTG